MITVNQEDTSVNLILTAKQKLCDTNIKKIHNLHKYRDLVIQNMKDTDIKNKDKLLELLSEYRMIETKLKKQWKFPLTDEYAREYTLPHCTCPVMDNDDDYYGVSTHRWTAMDCPYHGV